MEIIQSKYNLLDTIWNTKEYVHVKRKIINLLHGLTEYVIRIHASVSRIVVL